VYEKNHFVVGERKVADTVLPVGIRPDNFLEAAAVVGFNVHFGPGDRLVFGIPDHTLNSCRAARGGSPSGYGRNEQSDETEFERFNKHKITRLNRISDNCPFGKQSQT